jgi:hypothetical protein
MNAASASPDTSDVEYSGRVTRIDTRQRLIPRKVRPGRSNDAGKEKGIGVTGHSEYKNGVRMAFLDPSKTGGLCFSCMIARRRWKTSLIRWVWWWGSNLQPRLPPNRWESRTLPQDVEQTEWRIYLRAPVAWVKSKFDTVASPGERLWARRLVSKAAACSNLARSNSFHLLILMPPNFQIATLSPLKILE